MLLLLAALTGPAIAATPAPSDPTGDTVYPDGSDALVSVRDLEQRGIVLGRTGRLLAAADPAALRSMPEIADVTALPGGVLRIVPAPGVDDLALARALHARADVDWVHPDFILPAQPSAVPNDPLLADEWHLHNTGQGGRMVGVDINAEPAWDYANGAGVLIAVIDSGVQLDHPDLSVIAGHDYIDQDEDPSPDGSSSGPHGTCVSGVAAGTGDNGVGVAGVAWAADVYAVRLIGGSTTMDDLYSSFTESVDAGAAVLSNSWGWGDDCSIQVPFSSFSAMFNYAENQGRGGLGSVVVFAAGNGGCDIANDGMLEHDKLIVVAAVESNDVRAWYSNFGDSVDISAPTTLLTTDMVGGGYGSYGGDDAYADGFAGTSAATPVVSGVVALMIEANPRITAGQIREVLCRTSVRIDTANAGYNDGGWSPYYGCGRIDAGAAVAAVVNSEPSAPVPTLTTATTWEGRAVLAWEAAADPDGDVTGYEVSWWRAGEDAEAAPISAVPGLSVEIGGSLAVGDEVTWVVRAVDPWGAGPWSAASTFTVLATEVAPEPDVVVEEEGGCAHSPGGGWIGALLGVVAVGRRRAARMDLS